MDKDAKFIVVSLFLFAAGIGLIANVAISLSHVWDAERKRACEAAGAIFDQNVCWTKDGRRFVP